MRTKVTVCRATNSISTSFCKLKMKPRGFCVYVCAWKRGVTGWGGGREEKWCGFFLQSKAIVVYIYIL